MNTFIELLERKIDGCDALGGLEREKAVYQSVLKDYKKQLNLTNVVGQGGQLVCDVCDGIGTRCIEGETDDCWFCSGTGEAN